MDEATVSQGEEQVRDDRFGRYRLIGKLAEDRLADVYLAEVVDDAGRANRVALTCVGAALSDDPRFIRAFLNGAASAARLAHPNVVRTIDFGKIDDRYFIATEYVPGRSLGTILARAAERGTAVPAELAAAIVARVCDATLYAHAIGEDGGRIRGPAHARVAPDSVLVSATGDVKLSGFAPHRVLAGAAAHPTSSGSPAHAANGNGASHDDEAQADVAAVGGLLLALLAGRPATVDSGEVDVEAATAAAPEPLRLLARCAVDPDPEQRIASVAEMRLALEGFLSLRPEVAPRAADLAAFVARLFDEPALAVEPAHPPRPRLAWMPWLCAAGAVAFVVAIGIAQTRSLRAAQGRANGAVAALRAGRPAEAIAGFERAFAAAPSWSASDLRARHGGDYRAALARDGERLLAAGNLDGAERRFRAVVALDPRNVDAHLRLGRILARAGDPVGAEREWRTAADLDPSSIPAHRELASLAFDAGRYGEALGHYERLAALHPPDEDEVWLRIAECHQQSARRAAADADAALQRGVTVRVQRGDDAATSQPPASGAVPAAARAVRRRDLVHRVACPNECLRDIAQWHTSSAENWKKLVSPVNRGATAECVALKVGSEVRIPAELVRRSATMPCGAGSSSPPPP